MYIADLHIHSKFSLATSKMLVPEYLDLWARYKGITLVGTGDFTHPLWLALLQEKLERDETGLYRLKKQFRLPCPIPNAPDPHFILTAEISNIYKKRDKTRKVHNVIFVPEFKDAQAIQLALKERNFNITSDGRPILGLDSRNLLEICLEESPDCFFVPAHIWTPWFSALGEKSGFDSIEDCYADLTPHIHAVETGLSTNPPMNWMCSFLDDYTLLSNSDAHSPEKLGRNANIINDELSYQGLINNLTQGKGNSFGGTIDLFPQEGKYHYAGHRKCGVKWDPLQTEEHNGICPVCGKKIVLGVMNRIADLADRNEPTERKNRAPFHSTIPLKELVAEIIGVGVASKKVNAEYHKILHELGPELDILLKTSIQDIRQAGGELLAVAIDRMRKKEVFISEGFDGQYGVIKVFSDQEINSTAYTTSLFQVAEPDIPKPGKRELINFDIAAFRKLRLQQSGGNTTGEEHTETQFRQENPLSGLNPQQREAAEHTTGPAMVIAGPGTGKTRVLTQRIANMINQLGIDPSTILALTFTNKAAREMRNRLEVMLDKESISKTTITTFHAFGLSWLKSNHFAPAGIVDDEDKKIILKKIAPSIQAREISKLLKSFSKIRQSQQPDTDETITERYLQYQDYLQKNNLLDFDDLLEKPLELLSSNKELLEKTRKQFQYLLVDEYQDLNALQYRFIQLLGNNSDSNLFVIGDPNQAIYGFRGADNRYIDQFLTDYPGTKVYQLSTSYRCSEKILHASGNILQQTNEAILHGISPGIKIHIVRNQSSASEAEFTARKIEEMMGGLRFFSMDSHISSGQQTTNINSLSDFAVLCRTSKQMDAYEKAFNDHSIPFQKTGEQPWLKAEPFKTLIYILKDIYLPPNPIVKDYISSKELQYSAEVKNGNNAEFIIRNIAKQLKTEVTWYDLERLIRLLKQSPSVEAFLESESLGISADFHLSDVEKVNLMTIHAAKGLEFKCVFVGGVEDGLLPYSLYETRVADEKEEERLLYVAMTRAKEFLFLTHATRRVLGGRTYSLPRSYFLHRIENELVLREKQEHHKKTGIDDSQLALF